MLRLTGKQLKSIADYFGELLEDGDRLLIWPVSPTGCGPVEARVRYEDNSVGGFSRFETDGTRVPIAELTR